MKNRINFRKLNRTSEHRRALLRNLATALIDHERIRTTVPKAKELKRVADKMVTFAKTGTQAARRHAAAFVQTPSAVDKLFTTLGPRYATRPGGYCRVIRCGYRPGDQAPMAIIEYVDREGEIRPARPPLPLGDTLLSKAAQAVVAKGPTPEVLA